MLKNTWVQHRDESAALPLEKQKPITLTRLWRAIMLVAVLVGYQLLTYLDVTEKHPNLYTVMSACLPALVALSVLLWNQRFRLLWCFSLFISGMAVWRYHSSLVHCLGWICVLQRSTIFVILAVIFGYTLRPGKTPLISRIAETIHGPLNTRLMLYTRKVTLAWSLFFATLSGLLLLLFLLMGQQIWALFSGAVSTVLIASMFMVEYAVRCRCIPAGERSGIMEGVRAYFVGSGPAVTKT